jgi:hypothetical protein
MKASGYKGDVDLFTLKHMELKAELIKFTLDAPTEQKRVIHEHLNKPGLTKMDLSPR